MDLPGTGTADDDSEMSAGSSAAKGETAMRSAGRFLAHGAEWCHGPREADITQRSPQPGCPPFSALVILRDNIKLPHQHQGCKGRGWEFSTGQTVWLVLVLWPGFSPQNTDTSVRLVWEGLWFRKVPVETQCDFLQSNPSLVKLIPFFLC